MGTLIKVTSTPFQSIRYTQNARLVPSHTLAAERQRAMSLYRAYQSRFHDSGRYSSVDFMSQYRQAFSSDSSAAPQPQGTGANQAEAPVPAINQKNGQKAGVAYLASNLSAPAAGSASIDAGESESSEVVSMESVSEYVVQREAFEFRMAKGDFSYIPALSVTIVTQYPEVHFEYLGDFNYVPPRKDAKGDLIDIQA